MESKEYDNFIVKVVPDYKRMLQSVASALPFKGDEAIRVLDLGAGTGTLVKLIKERFPNSNVICLDTSEEMLAVAKEKLSRYEGVSFRRVSFDSDLETEYDAIVSSLALHHIPTEELKKQFFKGIYNSLSQKGVFYNADLILGEDEQQQKKYMADWRKFMSKSLTEEQILIIEDMKNGDDKDFPFRLVDEVKWLKEAGFRDVKIRWQRHNFALYGGKK